MQATYPNFVAFRDRLANRLMMLAVDCQDMVTRQELIAMASKLRGRTEPMPETTPRDDMVTISGWRH